MAATPPEKQRTPSIARTWRFFEYMGMFEGIPKSSERREFFSDLIRGLLKVDHIERGRVTCSLTVKPPVTNPYNTLHGGVVAAVAEMVALACARTVAGDKEFFLGESSTSYLSSTRLNRHIERKLQDYYIQLMEIVKIEIETEDQWRLILKFKLKGESSSSEEELKYLQKLKYIPY